MHERSWNFILIFLVWIQELLNFDPNGINIIFTFVLWQPYRRESSYGPVSNVIHWSNAFMLYALITFYIRSHLVCILRAKKKKQNKCWVNDRTSVAVEAGQVSERCRPVWQLLRSVRFLNCGRRDFFTFRFYFLSVSLRLVLDANHFKVSIELNSGPILSLGFVFLTVVAIKFYVFRVNSTVV